jgi:hypothetical protein
LLLKEPQIKPLGSDVVAIGSEGGGVRLRLGLFG